MGGDNRRRRTFPFGPVLWTVLVLALVAVSLTMGLTERRGSGVALALTWFVLALSLCATSFNRRKAHHRYLERYPTLDHVRRGLDQEALLRTRDTEGEVAAIRNLRRQLPEVPLTDATRVVREL